MKLFKNIDEKLADLGFKKVRENHYGAEYIRHNDVYDYDHKVAITRKASGAHLMQSYDPKNSNVVGLTGKEMKLFLKKMKNIGLYS